MADIQQAAKWMLEGKYVRRMNNKRWILWSDPSGFVCEGHGRYPDNAPFQTEDLLADDWVIDQ